MLALNTKAPNFALPDGHGTPFTRDLLVRENGLLVMFICNHCPFVLHYGKALTKLGDSCDLMGVGVVAINANDVAAFPQDAPHKMVAFAEAYQFGFPYLFDDRQDVARAYRAACTPDFYLFDQHLRLNYRGRFDASTPTNGKPITGADLYGALNSLIRGDGPVPSQSPSMGCNIKWRAVKAVG
jgi:peroxiredoxin